MKKTIIGVYNRNKNTIMMAEQLIEVIFMMKILMVLSAITVGLLVYLVWAFKNRPGEVVMMPVTVELEREGIDVSPAQIRESFDFKNGGYWDPDRLN